MAKTYFITGASSGLGLILTERILRRGERVVATYRKESALNDLKAQFRETLVTYKLDITDTAAIKSVVSESFSKVGKIDVVISNAGYGMFGAAEELTDKQVESVIFTNLIGSIHLIRTVLPFLRQQGGGRVVQVSSECGQNTYPSFSAYDASKWGIEGFIESVSKEVKDFGIDFVIMEPGATKTGFLASADVASPLQCYENTPSGHVSRMLKDRTFPFTGDADRTVDAMLQIIDQKHPPLRVVFGGTAYTNILAALKERLEVLVPQKDLAYFADEVEAH